MITSTISRTSETSRTETTSSVSTGPQSVAASISASSVPTQEASSSSNLGVSVGVGVAVGVPAVTIVGGVVWLIMRRRRLRKVECGLHDAHQVADLDVSKAYFGEGGGTSMPPYSQPQHGRGIVYEAPGSSKMYYDSTTYELPAEVVSHTRSPVMNMK